jgi:ferric-dicitrate binding protein FerR (iron transport regulator)
VAVYREGELQKVVSAKEYAFVPHNGPIRWETPTYDPGAWTKGALIARKMRLEDLVAELSGYDRRELVCSPEAADLKVSGVFQLDGPAPATRALESLSRALPIELVEKGDTLTILPVSP